MIDKSKIRRERITFRHELQMNNEVVNLTALYYDGRKDDTLKQFVQNGQVHQCLYKEEHYVVVSEPGGHCVSHVTPESGKAFDLFQSLYGILQSTNSVESIQVIGADSTNVNTGSIGGAVHFLESAVGRPLHYRLDICLRFWMDLQVVVQSKPVYSKIDR